MSAGLYPLRFEPIFQRYLWGGRRLAELLGKPIGEAESAAESWEIVDHAEYQSVVSNGRLAGKTLSQLVEHFGTRLVGERCFERISSPSWPENLRHRFPLLLKFLDASRELSVQVHPDNNYAQQMATPDLGKTEAWYVLHAQDDAVIYAGLKDGVDRERLAQHINAGTTESCLHVIRPKPGDCIFIPAGTVHAIGAGLVIAEIQQCSNTTFRLFDWNRVDASGTARPLHIDQSLDVINFEAGPVRVQSPTSTLDDCGNASRPLVSCQHFRLRHWTLENKLSFDNRTDDSFRIIVPLSESVQMRFADDATTLSLGQTVLLPADLDTVSFETAGESPFKSPVELLEIFQ